MDRPIHMAFVTFPHRSPKQTWASQLAEKHQANSKPVLPKEYEQHVKVFSEREAQRFPGPRIWDHAIELKKDAPATIPGKVYALTQIKQKALQEFLTEHLKKGYIRPSKSPYASPFFFIKKKDGKLRPVQDYRKVNEWTIRNRYPLPLIPELINRVKGSTLFSKFDVRWGYNNVRIKDGDEWKAAFITNQGLYKPRVMFFGLTNSPATFQTMMNAIFAEELLEGWVTIYMDDILIHTPDDLSLHRKRVHQILDKLRQHDLYLKPEKCLFEQREMEFLGVVLSQGQIRMDNAKLQGVADWPTPRTLRDVRAFLGFTGFYSPLLPNCTTIDRIDPKSNPIPLGRTTNQSLRNAQIPDVPTPHHNMMNPSSLPQMLQLMAWEPYSYRREILILVPKNQLNTQLHTTQLPSPQRNAIMTSMNANYWPS